MGLFDMQLSYIFPVPGKSRPSVVKWNVRRGQAFVPCPRCVTEGRHNPTHICDPNYLCPEHQAQQLHENFVDETGG